MTAPPGTLAPTETAAGHNRQVTAPEVTSKRQALRWLASELGITGAQAHRLVVAYEKDQRDADAREFIAEEFGPWLRRRGDLLVVRGRARREWKVVSS
jgi:hypothetical protein